MDFVLLFLVMLYMLPGIIAYTRNHNNKFAIAVLNVLLGWTMVGWVGALVWAFINPRPSYYWDTRNYHRGW